MLFQGRMGESLERVERGLLDLKDDPDFSISSRDTPGVIDLVLAGGGAKGVAHLGALWALDILGIRIKRLAGTSAGAITASIIAAGYSVSEMMDELFNMNFLKLRDGFWEQHLPKFARIAAVSSSYGLYEGKKMQSWIEGLLSGKNASTFGRLPMGSVGALAELDSRDGPRLSVMASDVTHSCELLMPPDLVLDRYGNIRPEAFPVAAAVRMSISVPFFFTPYMLAESMIVDGAFSSNLPLEIFDVPEPGKVRWPTLGINLTSGTVPANSTKDLFHFGLAVFDTMRYGQSRMSFMEYPTRICRLIDVDTRDVRTLDFGITREQKEQLFLNGARAVLDTLMGRDGRGLRRIWNFDTYLKLRERWSFPPMDQPYI